MTLVTLLVGERPRLHSVLGCERMCFSVEMKAKSVYRGAYGGSANRDRCASETDVDFAAQAPALFYSPPCVPGSRWETPGERESSRPVGERRIRRGRNHMERYAKRPKDEGEETWSYPSGGARGPGSSAGLSPTPAPPSAGIERSCDVLLLLVDVRLFHIVPPLRHLSSHPANEAHGPGCCFREFWRLHHVSFPCSSRNSACSPIVAACLL